MPIASIVIGDRARKDMGDLPSLAASMQKHGLLHPVVVKADGTLVAGHRRLEAARLIGWQEVAVTVVNVDDLLVAERDENTERKDFTPTEAVAIGRLIENEHRAKIETQEKIRNAINQKAKLLELGQEPAGAARKKAAAAVDMGESSYFRAKAVVAAAETDPAKFGDLPEKMDTSGNVSGTYREMERRKAGHAPDPEFTGDRPKRVGTRIDKTTPYEPKTTRQRQLAQGQKQRMVDCLSTMRGTSGGLAKLDAEMILSVCDADEIATWTAEADEICRAIRQFKTKFTRR